MYGKPSEFTIITIETVGQILGARKIMVIFGESNGHTWQFAITRIQFMKRVKTTENCFLST